MQETKERDVLAIMKIQFQHIFLIHLNGSFEWNETLCRYLSQCPEITARDFAGGRPEVPLHKKVLISLRYLGSQETIREIGDRFNVSDSAVVSCKRQVVSALANSLKTRFVKWPGQNELTVPRRWF